MGVEFDVGAWEALSELHVFVTIFEKLPSIRAVTDVTAYSTGQLRVAWSFTRLRAQIYSYESLCFRAFESKYVVINVDLPFS